MMSCYLLRMTSLTHNPLILPFFTQVLDLILSVNVEFMLCPTGAMTSVFSLLPSWILFPSYRSIITLLVFVIGPLISITYITAAKSVLYVKSLIFTPIKRTGFNNSNKKMNWADYIYIDRTTLMFATQQTTQHKTEIFHSRGIIGFVFNIQVRFFSSSSTHNILFVHFSSILSCKKVTFYP